MQLTSPKVHLSQTIHDWHRPLRIVPYQECTFGEVSCMQVIPFLCVFILDGTLFGDDVKNSCPALLYYMTEGWRLLRWGLGVVPAITYHCNAVPVHVRVTVFSNSSSLHCRLTSSLWLLYLLHVSLWSRSVNSLNEHWSICVAFIQGSQGTSGVCSLDLYKTSTSMI